KSRMQSADKLRAWMATFYVTFEGAFVEAVLPAVRVHLAWRQSDAEPRAEAERMAREHIADSTRQLSALLDAHPDDLQVALGHILTRWERDRPSAVADAILQDEVAHLRRLESLL